MYRYPQRDVNPMPGLTPNMLSVPYDVSGGGAHLRDSPAASQPVPIGALATSLANAAPEHQRTVKLKCCLFQLRNTETIICVLRSVTFFSNRCLVRICTH